MTTDKGKIFYDLRCIQAHLTQSHQKAFGLMSVLYYLNLIKSTYAINKEKGGFKQKIHSWVKFIFRQNAIRKIHSGTDLLVWVAEENHLLQILPVTRLLKEKSYHVTYLSSKKHLLRDKSLDEYYKLYIPLPSKRNATAIQTKYFEIGLRDALRKCELEIITEADIPVILKTFAEGINYTQNLESYLKSFLRKLNPKAALIGYDIPIEGRTITEILNCRNVPTFMIQHGGVAKTDGIFSNHISKSFMVYGEAPKQVLEQSGCVSSIIVTGAPYLDNIIQSLQFVNKKAHQKLKVLVAFSGPGHLTTLEHHKDSIKAIVQIAKSNPTTIEFYIKLHQKDKQSFYEEAMAGNMLNNIHFSLPNNDSKDIFDWIKFSDLVITGASTVALEAMLCEVPVISFDLTGDYKNVSFNQEGAAKYIMTKEELEKVIVLATHWDFSSFNSVRIAAKKYVMQYYGELDGKASIRCAKIIEPYLAVISQWT